MTKKDLRREVIFVSSRFVFLFFAGSFFTIYFFIAGQFLPLYFQPLFLSFYIGFVISSSIFIPASLHYYFFNKVPSIALWILSGIFAGFGVYFLLPVF